MSQKQFSIKEVQKEDWSLLKQLVDEVWPATFKDILSEAQISYMMEMMYSITSLKKQTGTGSVFYLLYDSEVAVGYLAIIPHYSDERLNAEATLTKVDKIYVLPKTQGAGAGRFLMDFAFAEAKKAGDGGVMLNVNRGNNAVSFYEYYGFKNSYSADFDIGNGYLMEDYIMYYPFKNS
ncbi:GNAT family N-acetyltransferase [Leeuwenhoekiella polynyae]|uniref:Acetyltransferase (GNAT) family protein n=1 Tax=Leeuwenhoekiella polynyae TaxID=1550906 RepID=A0A4Q0PFM5_9FLAO|nr:GNAT family N-acetyltransferase [Leeuwenhoekiella polynyae]RXG25770.1 acetyltransferase (GNAT) family protein [Leeuwenhoekiella polynyae]